MTKILHLEDSRYDAELVKRCLSNAKLACEIKVVDTKIDFQNSLKYFVPDVILSDHSLNQFDSTEALAITRIRKNNTPFILVTGTVSEEFAANCIKNGAYDYILKNNLVRLPNTILQALKHMKAEEEIQKNKKQFQLTIDKMLEGVQIIGFDWRYLYINDAVVRQGKYSKEELLGHTMLEKYPGIENTPLFGVLTKCMNERLAQTMENEFTYPDGTKGWFELSIQPAAEGIIILSMDIVERKSTYDKLVKAETEIRNFARYLNRVMEDERAHIAREIHDELGQQLAGIKIGLSYLKKERNEEPVLEEKINGMMKDVDTTIQSLRKIATELRPGILDTLGLIPSIQWLANEFEKKSGIKCRLILNIEEERFEKNISTCFFRICQEALTNISKHAEATEVVIHAEQNPLGLALNISDNGKGITSEKLENPFSMGLLGMRERANLIGADLRIASKTGSGTTIQLYANIH